jgi:hypothetical protein
MWMIVGDLRVLEFVTCISLFAKKMWPHEMLKTFLVTSLIFTPYPARSNPTTILSKEYSS